MFSLQEKRDAYPKSIDHVELAPSNHPLLKILEWTGFFALIAILFGTWYGLTFGWPLGFFQEKDVTLEDLDSKYTVASTSPSPLSSELKSLYTVTATSTTEIPSQYKDMYTITKPPPEASQ